MEYQETLKGQMLHGLIDHSRPTPEGLLVNIKVKTRSPEFRLRQDGTRRFRKAYIEIPKKNGKTQLIAGLALYMLLADNEPGAEVYVAAADRDQARILFGAAKAMVETRPALGKRLQIYQNSIFIH